MEGEADSSENGETGGAGENELASSLRTSIEVDSTISQHMKNVREMANNIPDAVTEAGDELEVLFEENEEGEEVIIEIWMQGGDSK